MKWCFREMALWQFWLSLVISILNLIIFIMLYCSGWHIFSCGLRTVLFQNFDLPCCISKKKNNNNSIGFFRFVLILFMASEAKLDLLGHTSLASKTSSIKANIYKVKLLSILLSQNWLQPQDAVFAFAQFMSSRYCCILQLWKMCGIFTYQWIGWLWVWHWYIYIYKYFQKKKK